MYENSRFLKNRFTFCGVNTNFGQQWAPPAYYHLTPIVSKGKHCNELTQISAQKTIIDKEHNGPLFNIRNHFPWIVEV